MSALWPVVMLFTLGFAAMCGAVTGGLGGALFGAVVGFLAGLGFARLVTPKPPLVKTTAKPAGKLVSGAITSVPRFRCNSCDHLLRSSRTTKRPAWQGPTGAQHTANGDGPWAFCAKRADWRDFDDGCGKHSDLPQDRGA